MSLSLGISQLALPNPPARPTPQSSCSSFSSQRWKLHNFTNASLSVRSNSRGRSSGHEVEAGGGISARRGLSAEYVTDGGEFSEEGFVDQAPVGYRDGAAGPRAAPQLSSGRFWRRFPGSPEGGRGDVTVPIEALRRGAVFRGTVSSVQPFGAFVNFGAFADGLVHISKLSTGFVKSVSDVVELDQEVMVSIVNVEESTGRISLSLMDKDQVDLRKPYVSSRLKESRQRGERPRFQSGSGRSAPTVGDREERFSKGSYSSPSRSLDSREGGGWPRYQPGSGRMGNSMPDEERERFSSNPITYSRQRGARRAPTRLAEAEEGRTVSTNPFASPRTGQFRGEDRQSRNPFASSRQQEAGEGDRVSTNPFASPRTGQFRGEDRQPRNPFASSRQGEAGEGDRGSTNPFASPRTGQFRGEDRQSRSPFVSPKQGGPGGDRVSNNPFASPRKGQSRGDDRQSRNPFASSRQWEARQEDWMSGNSSVPSRRMEAEEEGSSARFKYQGNDGNFKSRGRITRVGSEANREERTKPKVKLVQIQSDVKSGEDKVSPGMRNVMSSWFECDCC